MQREIKKFQQCQEIKYKKKRKKNRLQETRRLPSSKSEVEVKGDVGRHMLCAHMPERKNIQKMACKTQCHYARLEVDTLIQSRVCHEK